MKTLLLCLLGAVGVSHIRRAELAFQEPGRDEEGPIHFTEPVQMNRFNNRIN